MDSSLPLLEKLQTLATPEEKIAEGLASMREAISQEGSPHFREFWQARHSILPLFKENLHPAIRSRLWGEYVELTTEARRLKEVLEEGSLFAVEQIDLALQAMQGDLSNPLLTQTMQMSCEAAPQDVQTLAPQASVYQSLQCKIDHLQSLASRLNALRREVVQTEMRLRYRAKFFKQLSTLGDQIFPKRKELIAQISAAFEEDVRRFIETHFQGNRVIGAPHYALREEIKALQAAAKAITLQSATFQKTRLQLSQCWDQIRTLEKQRKQRMDEKKANTPDVAPSSTNPKHPPSAKNIQKDKEDREKEKQRKKQEELDRLKGELLKLQEELPLLEGETLTQRWEILNRTLLAIPKGERISLDPLSRSLKGLIAEKREKALLNLSENDRQKLEHLRLILEQKKTDRREIREHVDAYRKALGTSNLDFEKAIHYRELLEEEKERFAKADASIAETEQQIEELEKNS